METLPPPKIRNIKLVRDEITKFYRYYKKKPRQKICEFFFQILSLPTLLAHREKLQSLIIGLFITDIV